MLFPARQTCEPSSSSDDIRAACSPSETRYAPALVANAYNVQLPSQDDAGVVLQVAMRDFQQQPVGVLDLEESFLLGGLARDSRKGRRGAEKAVFVVAVQEEMWLRLGEELMPLLSLSLEGSGMKNTRARINSLSSYVFQVLWRGTLFYLVPSLFSRQRHNVHVWERVVLYNFFTLIFKSPTLSIHRSIDYHNHYKRQGTRDQSFLLV